MPTFVDPNPRELVEGDIALMNVTPLLFWQAEIPAIDPGCRVFFERFTKPENLHKLFNESPCGLYLHGPSGIGKTYAAVALAKAVRRHKIPAFFISSIELRDALKQDRAYRDIKEHQYSPVATYRSRVTEVPLLVLDGLNREDRYDAIFNIYHIEQLIAARALSGRLTIVTSPVGPPEFGPDGGLVGDDVFPGFFDRLRGCMVPVLMTGPIRKASPGAALLTGNP